MSDVVAVIDPPVITELLSDVMNAVAALRRVAKKLDEVALEAKRLVLEALTAEKLLVTVALTKVAEVANASSGTRSLSVPARTDLHSRGADRQCGAAEFSLPVVPWR